MIQKSQKGLGLLEVLLVIAITATILVMATRFFVVANDNLQVSQSITQIDKITKASYKWLAMHRMSDFSTDDGVTMSDLVDSGLLTKRDERSPWGGEVTVEAGTDPSHVLVTFLNVSQGNCKSLSQRLSSVAHTETLQEACEGTYAGEF